MSKLYKICPKCLKNLPATSFYTRNTVTDGKTYKCLSSYCKLCHREYQYSHDRQLPQGYSKSKRLIRQQRDPLREGIKTILYGCRWRSSKSNDMKFDITLDYLINLWESQHGICYYTGLPMIMAGGRGTHKAQSNSASIDKLIPQLGYIQGNIVWCCHRINTIKSNCTEQEFYAICQLIIDRSTTFSRHKHMQITSI